MSQSSKVALASRLLQKESFDSLISGRVQCRFSKPQCQLSSDNLKFLSSEKKFHVHYMLNMDES